MEQTEREMQLSKSILLAVLNEKTLSSAFVLCVYSLWKLYKAIMSSYQVVHIILNATKYCNGKQNTAIVD